MKRSTGKLEELPRQAFFSVSKFITLINQSQWTKHQAPQKAQDTVPSCFSSRMAEPQS